MGYRRGRHDAGDRSARAPLGTIQRTVTRSTPAVSARVRRRPPRVSSSEFHDVAPNAFRRPPSKDRRNSGRGPGGPGSRNFSSRNPRERKFQTPGPPGPRSQPPLSAHLEPPKFPPKKFAPWVTKGRRSVLLSSQRREHCGKNREPTFWSTAESVPEMDAVTPRKRGAAGNRTGSRLDPLSADWVPPRSNDREERSCKTRARAVNRGVLQRNLECPFCLSQDPHQPPRLALSPRLPSVAGARSPLPPLRRAARQRPCVASSPEASSTPSESVPVAFASISTRSPVAR